MYTYLKSTVRTSGWAKPWHGSFSPDTVSEVFIRAYEEKRCVDMEDRFRYYDANWTALPECMKRNSYQDALNLANKPTLMSMIKACNDRGFKNYCVAKQQRRA